MEGNWRCVKKREKMEDYLSGSRRLESPSVAGLEGGRAVSAAKKRERVDAANRGGAVRTKNADGMEGSTWLQDVACSP
jgi:hypothetical protein